MKRQFSTMAVTALAILALAGCSSGAGLGDIFGGGGSTKELRGRVDYVDTNNRYVVLTNVSGYGNMLSSGGGSTVRVYFDNSTEVEYQGQRYRPADLERGDEIAVNYDEQGGNIVARSMTVLYDSSTGGSGTYGTGSGYEQTIRGTVRHVDPSRRTIEIDRGGYGGTTIIEYDANTPVSFNNRMYRVQDLERGDEIDIRVRDLGNGRFLASNITVVRSMSSGSGTFGSQTSTIRGTVRYVDTNRREIALDQTTWISGFNTGAGTGTNTMIVRYDNNTNVEFGGRLYAPTNLERGDLVDVQLFDTTGTPLASRIVVVRDVNTR